MVCLYCDSVFKAPKTPEYRVPKPRSGLLPRGLFELPVGKAGYSILGRLAVGENSQVLLARRARATTEQVVVKVAQDKPSEEALRREYSNLTHLRGRDPYLDRLLPQPVDLAPARGRLALVYRWRSGFIHTLERARKEYPEGVDPAATVWMWNRILDQLTCLESLGYSHGDLRPEHLLVHARDHGVAFCGWSRARLGPQDDLAASGRCIRRLLGSDAPKALLELTACAHQFDHPESLQNELRKVAEAVFGPPQYRPFALPRAK